MTVETLPVSYKNDLVVMLRELLVNYKTTDYLIEEKEFATLNFLTRIYYLSSHELSRYIKATTKEDFLSIYKFILDSGYFLSKVSDSFDWSNIECHLFTSLIHTAIKYSLVNEMMEIVDRIRIYIGTGKVEKDYISSFNLVDLITDEMISYLFELGVKKVQVGNSYTITIKEKGKFPIFVEQLLQEKRDPEIKEKDIYKAVESQQSFHNYIVGNGYFSISDNVINYIISSGITDINKLILWSEINREDHKLLLAMRRMTSILAK